MAEFILLTESDNMRNIKEVKKAYCLLRLEFPPLGLTVNFSITGFLVLCAFKSKKEKENSGVFFSM